ncbi:hypothetical protein [Streptomyces sp. NPDC014656]|uniref:hypothetical protein n=1 Tax=Streptomyces sp. NPDC014656 TaxID=3364878 RepID=UPI0036FAEDBA
MLQTEQAEQTDQGLRPRRQRLARFLRPERLEDFDFPKNPNAPPEAVAGLGPWEPTAGADRRSGTGNSHPLIGTGTGTAIAETGLSVCSTTTAPLVNELARAVVERLPAGEESEAHGRYGADAKGVPGAAYEAEHLGDVRGVTRPRVVGERTELRPLERVGAMGGSRVLPEDDRVPDPGLVKDEALADGRLLVNGDPFVDQVRHVRPLPCGGPGLSVAEPCRHSPSGLIWLDSLRSVNSRTARVRWTTCPGDAGGVGCCLPSVNTAPSGRNGHYPPVT